MWGGGGGGGTLHRYICVFGQDRRVTANKFIIADCFVLSSLEGVSFEWLFVHFD